MWERRLIVGADKSKFTKTVLISRVLFMVVGPILSAQTPKLII